ncbi:lipocalin-like domain-containing protein [Paraburkholderia domus]|uniref:Lipocalin-like domain-containing protein n=1 Tax=Paraburkholderia domus TaxID=2793075 RepID=A0A9N8MYV7_9BURK|nr:lipocalin-like domain-containing protein [Paraburkholderia domus]MBK5059766.1 lipocalin-like domain-containing protein [Burkholderia sp. R-70199]MBK5121794.1 lipocalin-like domain-containing protein [Burkholderia sp. R-69980]MBK5167228.1 lipocalin-like domain-containing protein [Burkholderia sp. R-70211]MBK5180929.1 lipocalin-like domain-containing protein [Burkholderia sp. R-69749]MCI0145788.1 lipocalin-like domain-containing protein [Paraburkholderia sediminicola]
MEQERQNWTGPHLGTWKLQSFTTEDLATGQKTDLFGAHPSGYLSYGPDGRMYAILVKEGRKAPTDLVPTEAERVDLYSGFSSYAGTYSIEGDRVSHDIDASWNQSWTGVTQVRQFRIDGKYLHIKTLPDKNPITGRESISVLVWVKVE